MIPIPESKVIWQFLINQGIGNIESSTDWPIFRGFHPPADTRTPTDIISIFDSQGRNDGRLMDQGTIISHPGIQVRVRASEYDTAYVKIKAIDLALQAVDNSTVITVDGTGYVIDNFSKTGEILRLGREPETENEGFTLNGTVTMSLSG